jgi:glycine/D-amino acid oxidase-like deaminating enzyme
VAGRIDPWVADVVVIGGGIVGASAAAYLARTGRDVVLIERAAFGAGASGRNSGVVQHPFDPVLVELHRRSVELYRELAAEISSFRLPERVAGLLLVTRDTDVARGLASALELEHPGLRPSYLAPGEVERIEPGIHAEVAACRLEIGYPVAPMAATAAYATLLERLAVRSLVGRSARPTVADGRVTGVWLDDGRHIGARDVVVAAGPSSPDLVDPSGAWRPIEPVWGVVVGIELPDAPGHVLEEAEIEIEPREDASPGPARASTDEDDAPGHAFSLVTAAGSSSLGSTFLPSEPDATAVTPSLIRRGARFVPDIGRARVEAVRSCARPQSVDGRPVVGRIPWVDGLWIASGHGPWGISTGPATGELIADLVAGRAAVPPPPLDPARFGAAASPGQG